MRKTLFDRSWRSEAPIDLAEALRARTPPKPMGGFSQTISELQGRMELTPLRTTRSTLRLPSPKSDPPPLDALVFSRLAFGPKPADVDTFRNMGATPGERLESWVDWQLDPSAIADDELDLRLGQSNYQTLDKDLEQLWLDHVYEEENFEYRMLPIYETQYTAALRAIYSRRQLTEVLADFWHNHFNVYGWHFFSGPVFVQYDRDVIRANLLGNFRQFLEEMASSAAMLFYLDNLFSSADGPNENFAREVLELHAMGEENYFGAIPADQVPVGNDGVPLGYTDEDVRELARCLTGWSLNEENGSFLYRGYWHDDGPKKVLGLEIPAGQPPLKDVQDVFDRLAVHPGVASHVCTKLCRRLVADNPPTSLIDTAISTFLANTNRPDQLEVVVRKIVLSEEFSSSWGDKTRRPFELVTSAVRSMQPSFALPTDVEFSRWFFYLLHSTGNLPYNWAPPTGYPDRKEIWLTTNALVTSWRMINFLAGLDLDGWRPCDPVAATPPGVRTATDLADYWIDRALLRPMDESSRQEIIRFMAQNSHPNVSLDLGDWRTSERLRSMAGLVLMSPEFHWR